MKCRIGLRKFIWFRSLSLVWYCLVMAVLLLPVLAYGQSDDASLEYLKSLNIEDLLQTQVISVSKKAENLSDAAAAVFVITAEDIKRIGARNIPEALRIAPGIQVSQIDANKWAISARGFADLFSNKLLVLIDGRSVYTPLFAGVFWDVQDTVIEDIERIEVIRGPGATLWGANAVNGVINVITKSAKDTKGSLLSITSGNYDPVIAVARYGGAIGESGSYRLYAKGSAHDGYPLAGGEDANDSWKRVQSGFRIDLHPDARNKATFQGDVHQEDQGIDYNVPGLGESGEYENNMKVSGGNLLARWEQVVSEDSSISLQTYFDYTKKDLLIIEENRTTFDLDLQYVWSAPAGHEIIMGAGYRLSSDDINNSWYARFIPAEKTEQLFSLFLQDEITLLANRWWLTLGSKFEHNDYSGFEIQPNVRMRFKTEDQQTIWFSVSRAVRTPARADQDLQILSFLEVDDSGNTILGSIEGNENFKPEELIAYEAGHRFQPVPSISLDSAIFYNVYNNLRTLELGSPYLNFDSGSAYLVSPRYIKNGMSGETYGLELLATWQVEESWKLTLGYSLLQTSLDVEDGVDIAKQQFKEDDFPEHQIQLRSYFDLMKNISLDSELYYVDELSGRDVDSYIRLDVRLGWQVNDDIDLSISGENLTNSQHSEFDGTVNIVGSEVPRRFFAKLTYRH